MSKDEYNDWPLNVAEAMFASSIVPIGPNDNGPKWGPKTVAPSAITGGVDASYALWIIRTEPTRR
jgi:hypothetical protein